MRVAAIDIGTNTVLMLVAERSGIGTDTDDDLRAIEDAMEITRLGKDVDRTKRLDDARVAHTLEVLKRYAERARSLGVEKIAAVATSATRDADNGEQFRRRAAEILGGAVTVASGDREAALTVAGALGGLGLSAVSRLAVIDVGGGSTEIVVTGTGRVGTWAHSYDVGSVRLTERHVKNDPPTEAELIAIRDDARATYAAHPPPPDVRLGKLEAVVAIAGTATTYAAVDLGLVRYADAPPHGHRMQKETVERWIASLALQPLARRRETAGLEPGRADVIVAGGIVLSEAMSALGVSNVIVSDRGVRWGLAAELVRS